MRGLDVRPDRSVESGSAVVTIRDRKSVKTVRKLSFKQSYSALGRTEVYQICFYSKVGCGREVLQDAS